MENTKYCNVVTLIFKTFTFILFAWLLVFLVRSPFNVIPDADSAYLASVSKNLSNGVGYATTYHSKYLFNPLVSTGPTLILPTAILVKIWGNQYWVPGISMVVVVILLLCAVFFSTRNLLDKPEDIWLFSVLSLLLVICWSSLPNNNYPAQFLRWWYQLYGEVPAALLVVLSCSTLFFRPLKKRFFFCAGFFIGAAILTKLICLIAFVAILVVLVTIKYSPCGRDHNLRLIFLVFFLFGSVIPPLSFYFVKQISIENSSHINKIENDEVNFIKTGGSGFSQFLQSGDRYGAIWENFQEGGGYLYLKYFREKVLVICVYFLLLGLLLLYSFKTLSDSSPQQPAKRCGLALLIAFIFHFSWWLFLSPNHSFRHLSCAFTYFAFGVSSLVIASQGAFRKICIVLTLFLCAGQINNFYKLSTFNTVKNDNLINLLDTKKFLFSLEMKDTLLVAEGGYGGNTRLEYILNGYGNFKDYKRLSDEEKATNKIILVKDVGLKTMPIEWQERCPEVLFVRGEFSVRACK